MVFKVAPSLLDGIKRDELSEVLFYNTFERIMIMPLLSSESQS